MNLALGLLLRAGKLKLELWTVFVCLLCLIVAE